MPAACRPLRAKSCGTEKTASCCGVSVQNFFGDDFKPVVGEAAQRTAGLHDNLRSQFRNHTFEWDLRQTDDDDDDDDDDDEGDDDSDEVHDSS